jgi:ABC-type multidrug transport system fused ATPase/permease subunit
MHLLNKIQKIRISLSGLDFKSLIIIFMMVLSSLLDMMSVYFIAKLVSMPNILSSIYIVGINFSNEFFLLVIFFVVTLKASINYSYNLILYRFSTELENKIRLQLFSKIGQMKYLDFIKYSSAELSYTTTELTKNYSNGYVVPLFRLFNEVILICGLFLFLCNVNMQISFFVLSACLFFLIIYK